FMTDGRNPAVGITVTHGMLTVRVAARAAEPGEAQALCARELDVLRDLLGAEVVGEGDAPLQETLVGVLRARGLRLAVAESCTAGMLLSALGDVPGVSAVLAGGVVSYADEVKVRDLDVPADVLAAHGAVSEPVAAAMAAGAARRFGVPVALSVTGIAGPDGGTPDKPVGTVCFATAVEGTVVPFTRRFADLGREFIRRRSVLEAMAALLRRLRGGRGAASAARAHGVRRAATGPVGQPLMMRTEDARARSASVVRRRRGSGIEPRIFRCPPVAG